MNTNWENSVIIPSKKNDFEVLPPPNHFTTQTHYIKVQDLNLEEEIYSYIKKDTLPLPTTEDREGYYDNRHYDYWLSGLGEYKKIVDVIKLDNIEIGTKSRVLDFGCASGRVLRHFALQTEAEVWGCDINEDHVAWCNKFLTKRATVFQNTSLPHLQIEDNYFDLIYCLSVFTHIDIFETSWLCELRRTLKPGGIAYVTIHDETSWENMPKDWGVGYALLNHSDFKEEWLDKGFPNEKFVSRYFTDKSYSANVFYKIDYIKHTWSKFFNILQINPLGSNYQTVLVLQKPLK